MMKKLDKELIKYKKVIVFTKVVTVHIARVLLEYLKSKNINCDMIVSNDDIEYNDEFLYIIVCPRYKKVPKHYIAFNVEQTNFRIFFYGLYMVRLRKAIAIIDYSLTNINYLKKRLPNKEFYYFPVTFYKHYGYKLEEKNSNNPLFYGWLAGRRKKIFKYIENKVHLDLVVKDVYEKMAKILDEHKIVINIHHYKNPILETTRIFESLSHGCLVVSEKTNDYKEYTELLDVVDFVDNNDIDAFINRLLYWTNNPLKLEERLRLIDKKCKNSHNKVFTDNFDKLIKDFNLLDVKKYAK